MSEVTIRGIYLEKDGGNLVVSVEIDGKWVEVSREAWEQLYRHYILAGFIRERERMGSSSDSTL